MPSVRFVIGLSLRAKNVPYPPEDMGYPLREFLAERYYFLTSRTIDSQLLLRPDPEVNEILGEWLVRAQQQTGIELVVYVVMSNHWHAIVRAPQQKTSIDSFHCSRASRRARSTSFVTLAVERSTSGDTPVSRSLTRRASSIGSSTYCPIPWQPAWSTGPRTGPG